MNLLLIVLLVLLIISVLYCILQISIIKNENKNYKDIINNIIYAQCIDNDTGVTEELYIQNLINLIESILIMDSQKPPKERKFFK